MAKASAAQMKLLSELRAKELKDLTPAEYAMVEREVSANGFQDLKGTAAQIVFNAIRKRDKEMKKAIVEKHGSHDQKTHGAWSGGGMGSGQEKSMNAATDTVVEAYRNNNTGRVGVQAELGQAVKHHNKAVESLKAGKTSEASKHSLNSMKSLMNAARDAEGIDKTVLESSAQRYSELMVRALETEKVEKHGSHDQRSHGAWSSGGKGKYNTDDSEGEDSSEPKNYKDKAPKISYNSNDTEGEFGDNTDDPKWMDEMDVLRPPKRTPGEKAPFGGINFAATWRRTQK